MNTGGDDVLVEYEYGGKGGGHLWAGDCFGERERGGRESDVMCVFDVCVCVWAMCSVRVFVSVQCARVWAPLPKWYS